MDIVLGVSMTATTVRMVLVEGERADGVSIESEAFDTVATAGLPKPSPSEQVSGAILAINVTVPVCGWTFRQVMSAWLVPVALDSERSPILGHRAG